jgi:hypothetical protein
MKKLVFSLLTLAQILICVALALAGYEDFFKNRKIHELDFIPMITGGIIALYYYPIFALAEFIILFLGIMLWWFKLWGFGDTMAFAAVPLLLSMQLIIFALFLFVCISFLALQLKGRGKFTHGYPLVSFVAASYVLVWLLVLVP